MVYVLNINGDPLMPTNNAKARKLLKSKKATVIKPNDLVKYDGKIYTVKGTQNGGKYIALKEIKKVPKVELILPYKFRKGFVYGLC